MSEDSMQTAARRRRVQRLKKCIILTLMISIAVPIILCVVLVFQVSELSRRTEQLSIQLGELQAQVQAAEPTGEAGVQETIAAREADREIFRHELEQDAAGSETDGEAAEPEISAQHKVYLTFDDGPSVYTEDILDILDRYELKATFFVVGKETDSAKASLKEIVERGHTLGMHSYSHKYSEIYSSVEAFGSDFARIQGYLEEVTGVKSVVYRFPGGSSNEVSRLPMEDFADYLEEQGAVFFDWNISSGDGGSTLLTVERLVKNVTAGIGDMGTSVILLHDSGDKRTTVEALPIIIENILAMEDTVILPITEDTEPVQHIQRQPDYAVGLN